MGDGRKEPGPAPACLPGSCKSSGTLGRQVLGGDRQPPPLPLLHLVGESPSSLLAPCCPKPPPHMWLEHPAAGSSSSVPSRPGVFWGFHSDQWLLGSCQDLSGLGIPSCVGSTPDYQGPPGRHLSGSDGNSRAGPYRTSHLAPQPFPALPWLAARQHSVLPSLIARWLIAIPWRWTPTGVGCQG